MSFTEQIDSELAIELAIDYLEKEKKVFINSGPCNDQILSYSTYFERVRNFWKISYKKEYIFTTTACVFPAQIKLSDYEQLRTEEFDNSLFIYIE